MARLIDERPEDVEENDIDTTLDQEPQVEATLEVYICVWKLNVESINCY